jgi:tetratricopeptide (TPR) repeat protein
VNGAMKQNGAAELAYLRLISIREKARGPDDLDLANDCLELANFYMARQRYAVAEPNLRRAVRIIEKAVDLSAPALLPVFDSLVTVYMKQEKYGEAVPLLRRALAIEESIYGPVDVSVATYLDRLGLAFYLQDQFAEAQPIYERSLAIWEQGLEADSPELATSLDALAVVCTKQQKFAEAEPLYRRSLAIREKVTVDSMNNMGLTLEGKGDFAGAETVYRQAVTAAEHIPVLKGHSNVKETEVLGDTLRNYAILLHNMKRDAEAAKLEARRRVVLKLDQKP